MVDTTDLLPPIRMLRIVLHWVESNPELFYSSRHPGIVPSKLPLLHSHSDFPNVPRSPITGIIQWCTLAPMVDDTDTHSGTNPAGSNSTGTKSTGSNFSGTKPTGSSSTGTKPTGSNSTGTNLSGMISTSSNSTEDRLLAQIHAELLSALLSLSQSQSSATATMAASLNSDDIAMIVAALIAFSQRLEVGVAGRQPAQERGNGELGEKTGDRKMEEAVERFAQFLQISMSTKLLQLKPGI